MTKISVVAAVVAAIGLSACAASGPTPQEIAAADYGPPPPAEYQQIIKDRFAQTLIDPTSPLYTFDEPRRSYVLEAPMYGRPRMFGWRVCGTVNAKNRMGGYTGKDQFLALFRNGALVHLNTGADMVGEACRR